MSFKQRYTNNFKHASFWWAIITSLLLCSVLLFNYSVNVEQISILHFILIFFIGWFFWTFCEYMIHRFIFHKSDHRGNDIHYVLHGIHHAFPTDTIFLPIRIRIPTLSIICLILIWLLWIYGYPFSLGFVFGFSVYGCLHYLMHHKTAIKSLQHLVAHHMHHHEIRSHRAYGVSTQLRDKIFGTMPPQEWPSQS
jgi:sterol desaturase/sphingolipid hydroxylase (fatty acid hydroxylase superfamily)